MSTFTPYQVDYSVKNQSKNLGFSKKRVVFKFGFANEDALKDGQNGPACRGSEHELSFVWSLNSGKRQLLLDNKDIHFSESGQNGWTVDHTWQHAFNLTDKTTKKMYRFHFITQPASKERPEIKPFDLRVGGLSYFQFNPIYELGTPKMIIMPAESGAMRRAASPMSAEERRQLAAAKLASLRDLNSNSNNNDAASKSGGASLQREEVSLINFDADEPPPPPIPASNPYGSQPVTSAGGTTYQPYFASSVTMDAAIDENVAAPGSTVYGSNPYGAPPPPQQQPPPPGASPYFTPQQQPQYNHFGAPSSAPPPPPAGALPPSQASVNAGFPQAPPAPAAYPPQPGGFAPFPPAPAPPTFQPYGSTTNNQGALAPYQHAAPSNNNNNNNNPYVDATGRVSVQQPYNNYNLTSPSGTSQYSYGSAPGFAQPPPAPQQQYQQQQQQYAPPQQQQQQQYPFRQGY